MKGDVLSCAWTMAVECWVRQSFETAVSHDSNHPVLHRSPSAVCELLGLKRGKPRGKSSSRTDEWMALWKLASECSTQVRGPCCSKEPRLQAGRRSDAQKEGSASGHLPWPDSWMIDAWGIENISDYLQNLQNISDNLQNISDYLQNLQIIIKIFTISTTNIVENLTRHGPYPLSDRPVHFFLQVFDLVRQWSHHSHTDRVFFYSF